MLNFLPILDIPQKMKQFKSKKNEFLSTWGIHHWICFGRKGILSRWICPLPTSVTLLNDQLRSPIRSFIWRKLYLPDLFIWPNLGSLLLIVTGSWPFHLFWYGNYTYFTCTVTWTDSLSLIYDWFSASFNWIYMDFVLNGSLNGLMLISFFV